MRVHKEIDAEDRHKSIFEALPFGVLALIGAALGGYGVANQLGMVRSQQTVETASAVFLPPFLILLGALLLVSMGYYFFRALFSEA